MDMNISLISPSEAMNRLKNGLHDLLLKLKPLDRKIALFIAAMFSCMAIYYVYRRFSAKKMSQDELDKDKIQAKASQVAGKIWDEHFKEMDQSASYLLTAIQDPVIKIDLQAKYGLHRKQFLETLTQKVSEAAQTVNGNFDKIDLSKIKQNVTQQLSDGAIKKVQQEIGEAFKKQIQAQICMKFAEDTFIDLFKIEKDSAEATISGMKKENAQYFNEEYEKLKTKSIEIIRQKLAEQFKAKEAITQKKIKEEFSTVFKKEFDALLEKIVKKDQAEKLEAEKLAAEKLKAKEIDAENVKAFMELDGAIELGAKESEPVEKPTEEELVVEKSEQEKSSLELFKKYRAENSGKIKVSLNPSKKERTIAKRLEDNLEDATKQQDNEIEKHLSVKGEFPDYIKTHKIESRLEEINKRTVGIASCQGYRPTMEDADLATSFSIKGLEKSVSVFGVFDGHGGSEASSYVEKNLVGFLKGALEENQNFLKEDGIFKALKICCEALDGAYKGTDGTTAILTIVIGEKIYVANVGDSRAVFVKDGQAIQASEDAKLSNDPDNKDKYTKKIERMGGSVYAGRVFSATNHFNLGCARAIGDHHITAKNGLCSISPNPKITSFSLKELEGATLVLACDGLWDVLSSNKLPAVLEEIEKVSFSVDQMAKRLVGSAILNGGSKDNVSAMIIKI